MKTMTCQQLGGACEVEFSAETFEGIAELSKRHGMKMFEQKDEAHLKAMSDMSELMKDPNAMQKWFEGKKQEFNNLEEN